QRFAREVKTQVEQDSALKEIGKIKLDAENNLRAVERSLQEQVFGAEKQAREISRSVEAEIQAAAESLDKPQAGKLPPETGNTAPGVPQPAARQTPSEMPNKSPYSSFRRKPESSVSIDWTPAFAGVTACSVFP